VGYDEDFVLCCQIDNEENNILYSFKKNQYLWFV